MLILKQIQFQIQKPSTRIFHTNQDDFRGALMWSISGQRFRMKSSKINHAKKMSSTQICSNDRKHEQNSIQHTLVGWNTLKRRSTYRSLPKMTGEQLISFAQSILALKFGRRLIASNLWRVFDLFRLGTPVLRKPKILFQKTRHEDLAWSFDVTSHIAHQSHHWMDKFGLLSSLTVPRHLPRDTFQQVDLYLFCDASEMAYGAAIYAKTNIRRMSPFLF